MYAVRWVLRLAAGIVIFWPSQMISADISISTWWNTSLKHLKSSKFQSEVENHRNKKIKFLRSDRGGEYLSYEFGLDLKKCGIVSQLAPPGTPQRNGVYERCNRTLLDMVQSMMSLTDLPLSFWGYSLNTAASTLKRAPSKSVETTAYELWFGKKPKLTFLKVWDCDAHVKKLQPDKLEPIGKICLHRIPKGDCWVHLLSQIRRKDLCC
mgnify:CR=1 FL=1